TFARSWPLFFFFSSRRRHTRFSRDWSSDVCSSDLAMAARPHAQAFMISNAGSDRSVVLNDYRDAALRFIERGEGDPRLGLFEWSCEASADPLDLRELAKANPNL